MDATGYFNGQGRSCGKVFSPVKKGANAPADTMPARRRAVVDFPLHRPASAIGVASFFEGARVFNCPWSIRGRQASPSRRGHGDQLRSPGRTASASPSVDDQRVVDVPTPMASRATITSCAGTALWINVPASFPRRWPRHFRSRASRELASAPTRGIAERSAATRHRYRNPSWTNGHSGHLARFQSAG